MGSAALEPRTWTDAASVAVALVVHARLAEAHVIRVGVEHDDPSWSPSAGARAERRGKVLPEIRLPHRHVWRPNRRQRANGNGIRGERKLPHLELRAVGRVPSARRPPRPGGATHQGVGGTGARRLENDAVPSRQWRRRTCPSPARWCPGGGARATAAGQAGGAVPRSPRSRGLEFHPCSDTWKFKRRPSTDVASGSTAGLEHFADPAVLLERSVHVVTARSYAAG